MPIVLCDVYQCKMMSIDIVSGVDIAEKHSRIFEWIEDED